MVTSRATWPDILRYADSCGLGDKARDEWAGKIPNRWRAAIASAAISDGRHIDGRYYARAKALARLRPSSTQERNRARWRAEIEPLIAAGKTRREIAAALGILYPTLLCRIFSLGGLSGIKRQPYPTENAARYGEIVAARAAGETLQSVGDRHGISRERVRQIVAKHRPELADELRAARKQQTKAKHNLALADATRRKKEKRCRYWCELRAVVEMRCINGLSWIVIQQKSGRSMDEKTPASSAVRLAHARADYLGIDIAWLFMGSRLGVHMRAGHAAKGPPIPPGWIAENEARFRL